MSAVSMKMRSDDRFLDRFLAILDVLSSEHDQDTAEHLAVRIFRALEELET